MSDPHSSGGDGGRAQDQIDWVRAERSPEFKELLARRKKFVLPATIFFFTWYFGFIVLAGYAPSFMGEEFLTDGVTVGYVLAFSQFIMVWGLGYWYVRKSDREFDPLAAKAAERALDPDRAKREAGTPETDGPGSEEAPR